MLERLKAWLELNKKEKKNREFEDGYGYAAIHLLHYGLPEEEIPDCIIHPTDFDLGIRAAISDINKLKSKTDRRKR